MHKIDYYLMDLQRRFLTLFYKFLYFFMFRKYKNCKSFCPKCQYFDKCMEDVKRIYRLKRYNK